MTHQLNLKVYIAGPMTGLPDFNYPAFNKAAEDLAKQGLIPLNPTLNKGKTWLDFMRGALRQIAEADCLYMLAGWQNSKGASTEHTLAKDIGLPIFYENELPPAKKPATESKFDLQSNEQYNCQMAAIGTASFGYWKEGDSIHPDYDTIPLRDVAKLYAKYEALSKKYDALAKEKADHIKLHTKEIRPGVKEGWTDTQSEAKLAEKVVQAAYDNAACTGQSPDHPSTGQDIRKVKRHYVVAALDIFDKWVAVGDPSDDYGQIEREAVRFSMAAPGLPVKVLPVKEKV